MTTPDRSKIDIQELKDSIEKSSPPVKVQVFYQASQVRSRSWQNNENKPYVERTIPIFEALIASDTEARFHQNHGQLGYALKDRRSPDFPRAEAELTKAIEIRGSASEYGWEIYELNRAICRIKQDAEFSANRPSLPEERRKILEDLKIGAAGIPDLFDDADIIKWLRLNDIKDVLNLPDETKS